MYLQPTTLAEALSALSRQPLRVLAGGTDVFPAQGERPLSEPVLDISRIGGLAGITFSTDHIRFGATTTWSAIARATLPPAFRALQQAAREVGALQIQNAGTIGGNLCNASPAADGVPPLLALEAQVELASSTGTRRLPLADFITGYRKTALRPGELVAAILVPRGLASAGSAFLKLGVRRYLVISIAMVAAVLKVEQGRIAAARVAVGACSPVACRLPALEAALLGKAAKAGFEDAITPGHLAGLAPIDDVRASAAYRLDAVRTLIGRTLDAALEQADG